MSGSGIVFAYSWPFLWTLQTPLPPLTFYEGASLVVASIFCLSPKKCVGYTLEMATRAVIKKLSCEPSTIVDQMVLRESRLGLDGVTPILGNMHQIFHYSVKLDSRRLATLRVRAFDNEGNVFSSLVGLQFKWTLMPETNGLPHHRRYVSNASVA
ncbi:hypothetical protein VNO77_31010 [Canavalia gladiata]|uniref:NUP210 Ig-like domain-containing protein n=1 Tax=Canavalia gladiata TaxID=3824 RepID=A0AAN9Q1L9_CANGL